MPCRPALSEQSNLTGIRHTSESSQTTELVNMSLGKLVAAGSKLLYRDEFLSLPLFYGIQCSSFTADGGT